MTANNLKFQLLREAMGLSQQHAADVSGVNRRTVERWERGEIALYDDRLAVLEELWWQFQDAIDNNIEAALSLALDPDAAGVAIVLLIYANDRDYIDSHGHSGAFPTAKMHRVMVAHVMDALTDAGCSVELVTFDPASYYRWLAARDDSPAMRSQWAAESLSTAENPTP